MAKASHSIPEEKIALYDKLIAAHPHIERKGKAMPYTSLNGHMFSFLDATGTMGLRLSKEDAEAFEEVQNATYGAAWAYNEGVCGSA